MAERVESATAADDESRTGDSYEQIFATVLGYLPDPNYVFGQTDVFYTESRRVALPLIAIDPQRIPLPLHQLDAGAVAQVQIRMKRVETCIFNEAVDSAESAVQLIVGSREALAQAIAFRCTLALCYGIPLDDSVPPYRTSLQAIEPGLPRLGRIEIRGDDRGDFVRPPVSKSEK